MYPEGEEMKQLFKQSVTNARDKGKKRAAGELIPWTLCQNFLVSNEIGGKYQWNEWACLTASFGDEECYAHRAHIVNTQRDNGNLPSPPNAKSVGFWKCSCFFGAVGVNMTNANFVPKTTTRAGIKNFGNSP
ncbi:hypothetical protein niasHT_010421 [Heterodera trifolii]|uniref:Uncharacterized protein n=1 Tax=Heterodera trifolii TaxID=157864 RepID=A0ABD2MAM5_9BILA